MPPKKGKSATVTPAARRTQDAATLQAEGRSVKPPPTDSDEESDNEEGPEAAKRKRHRSPSPEEPRTPVTPGSASKKKKEDNHERSPAAAGPSDDPLQRSDSSLGTPKVGGVRVKIPLETLQKLFGTYFTFRGSALSKLSSNLAKQNMYPKLSTFADIWMRDFKGYVKISTDYADSEIDVAVDLYTSKLNKCLTVNRRAFKRKVMRILKSFLPLIIYEDKSDKGTKKPLLKKKKLDPEEVKAKEEFTKTVLDMSLFQKDIFWRAAYAALGKPPAIYAGQLAFLIACISSNTGNPNYKIFLGTQQSDAKSMQFALIVESILLKKKTVEGKFGYFPIYDESVEPMTVLKATLFDTAQETDEVEEEESAEEEGDAVDGAGEYEF